MKRLFFFCILATVTYSASVGLYLPFIPITGTSHNADIFSKNGTSYFGFSSSLEDSNIYTDIDYQFIIPFIFYEGKWSELSVDKRGQFLHSSALFRITELNYPFKFVLGSSAMAYRVYSDSGSLSYVGLGLCVGLTYTLYKEDEQPVTFIVDTSLNTDGNTVFVSPRFKFLYHEIFKDKVEDLSLDFSFLFRYNYSSEYSFFEGGAHIGIIF
jgi:hypothetical protein